MEQLEWKILILQNLKIFRFLKSIFFSSHEHLQTLFIIVITLEEFVLLRDKLREHKFKHGFEDTLNPLCSCGNDIESTEHFLFHSPQFANERRFLLSTSGNFNYSLLENTSNVLTQTLLFGNISLSSSDNSKILSATIHFILSTKRFDKQLF